jgi:hypothetical protein
MVHFQRLQQEEDIAAVACMLFLGRRDKRNPRIEEVEIEVEADTNGM